jgi:glycosyltransferase 2 family protein
MKYAASVFALAGLAFAVALFARENVSAIVALLIVAGPGLLVAALFHVVPMIVNARAWQQLLPESDRTSVGVLTWAIWVRESVNGLLPVARIGGEIVAYRTLRSHVDRGSDVAASLVADVGISVLSQTAFALLGFGLLFTTGPASAATTTLLIGVAWMIPLGAGFVLIQQQGVLGIVTRFLDRFLLGHFRPLFEKTLQLDDALRAVYARRRDIGACFAWQLAAWILGAGELWLALYFLGHPRSVLDAIAIEAIIQAIASAAFVVPGALGVQEGGFLLIGAALGLDSTTALALATARRLRDVIVFFPGLIAWQWAEKHNRDGRLRSAAVPPRAQ